MKASAGALFIALLIFGIAVAIHAYWNTIYAIDRAKGWLGRAQTAGTPESYIIYMEEALKLLKPFHGNPCWLFPTEYTNMDNIKRDIESCIERAQVLSTLSPESDAYQQGMDDLRGKITVFHDQLEQVTDWLFFYKPINIILAICWVIVEFALFIYWVS